MWTAGDIALTIESLHGATPPTPSVADIFYVAFYPAAYLALALLLRRESSRLVPATWLDGAVAGLGAAALCAAFAFQSIVHLAGDGPAAVATELAYPVGDVLLLAMAVGGSVLIAGPRWGAWRLVALGCAINAIGDAYVIVQPSTRTWAGSSTGSPGRARSCSCRWRCGCAATGATCSPTRPRRDSCCRESGRRRALAILLHGSMHRVDPVAVGLATATLVVVGLRLGLSVGSLRALTEERHRQAVTDQLTGLGNRRRLAAVLEAFFADAADPGTEASRPGVPVRRPRSLQGGQRLVRPSGRRPAAHPDRAAVPELPRADRPARADRRRRARGRPARLGCRPCGARRRAAGGDARRRRSRSTW